MGIDFKKYSSIENIHRTKTMNDITEMGLNAPTTLWACSEKLHGSSFAFYINSSEIKIAKRTSFLEVLGANFFNAEIVLDEHLDRLKLLYIYVSELYTDIVYQEDNELEIILYGELAGGTYPHKEVEAVAGAMKVQKGVYYSPDNIFYAFDMKINNAFVDVNLFEELMEEVGFLYAKSLHIGTLQECLDYPNEFQTLIPDIFGLPSIEDNTCEGTVIKPVSAKYFRGGGRVILKNKNEKWKEKASVCKVRKTQVKVDLTMSEEENALYVEATMYAVDNRLRNVISKIGEINDKMFGKLQGLFMKDVMEDFRKDNGEKWDALDKKRAKVIQVNISNYVRERVRANFLNCIDGTF